MIKNRVDGLTATRLRQFGDEYDVIVRYKESARNSITETAEHRYNHSHRTGDQAG